VASVVADTFGRKVALGATYVLLVASNALMALAPGYATLLAGRCIMGVGMGAGLCVVTAYIAEVSPKSMRARFVCLEELFLISGITCGYCLNYLLASHRHNWRLMFAAGALPVLVAGALLFLPQLPESPRWMLLREDRRCEAEATLAAVVGKDEARQMILEWEGHSEQSVASWPEVLCPRTRGDRNSMVAGLGVMFFQLGTGIPLIAVYVGHILTAEMSLRQALLCTTLMGTMRVAGLFVSIFFLLDHVGRRPLLLLSSCGMAVCMTALAVLYSVEGFYFAAKIAALSGFGICHALGLGPGTYVYVAEVLDTRIRSKGISLGLFFTRILVGVLMTLFPLLEEGIGMDGIFTMLSLVNAAAIGFLYCCVQETKNMSLETIREVFEGSLVYTPRRS